MTNNSCQMKLWYERAQIDYVLMYTSLYAAYNAWYREETATLNDRQALNTLRKGTRLWDAYCRGTVLQDMAPVMRLLVEYTQREPLSYASPHWKGEVTNTQDWASLVEYWYRVRCLVVHGDDVHIQYVHLAYESLNIFMGEILATSIKLKEI